LHVVVACFVLMIIIATPTSATSTLIVSPSASVILSVSLLLTAVSLHVVLIPCWVMPLNHLISVLTLFALTHYVIDELCESCVVFFLSLDFLILLGLPKVDFNWFLIETKDSRLIKHFDAFLSVFNLFI